MLAPDHPLRFCAPGSPRGRGDATREPQGQRGAVGGQPGGAVVKCGRSASVARGSPVQILCTDMPRCGRRPTYKVEEDGHGC